MRNFVIVVEHRLPRTAEERRLAGRCVTEDAFISRVFINAKQPRRDVADTFFHEMAHAYMHWRRFRKKRRQESLAMVAGRAAARALRSND